MENGIGYAFTVVVVLIVIDVFLGVFKALKTDHNFDIRKLPQFLASGVLPYIGGLGVLALAAQFVGEPFGGIFYPATAAVAVKYVAEIKDKVALLYGVDPYSNAGM